MTHNLGRLERVELRTVWGSESGNFTPWLASAENLALLGETIGLDLELEATEKTSVSFVLTSFVKTLPLTHGF